MVNFRKFEVTGATKLEALKKVADHFALNVDGNVKGDATQAYKLAKKKAQESGKAWTASDDSAFFNDYLTKKKAIAGEAYVITIDSAVADTRERPYKIIDVKNEKGKRKFKTFYTLIDKETGAVLKEVDTTKADAKNVAKQLIIDGFHGKMICKYTHQVVEGEPLAFEAEYAPSVNAKQGVYVVFGIEKA